MRHRQWRKRLEKLGVLLPPAPTIDVQERQKRRRQVAHRLVRLCQQACELMTQEEQINVAEGFKQWAEAEGGPYRWWFRDLFQGGCRLPELAPATMKELLVTWLSPDCDPMTRLCRGCGLQYPQPRVPPLNEWKLLPGKVPRVGPPPGMTFPSSSRAVPDAGLRCQTSTGPTWWITSTDHGWHWMDTSAILFDRVSKMFQESA